MDKKDHGLSSDDENYEDANERIVNEIIEQTKLASFKDYKAETLLPVEQEDCPDEKENSEPEDNENEHFAECETSDLIEDESQKDVEKDQTEEQREKARLEAEELKKKGNEAFKSGDYDKSAEIYTAALRVCPVLCPNDRSVLYSNRAAAKQKLDLKPAAIDDCTKSIEFNPNYVKVLLR
jgi:tetratricopeptide (TPR) repeat protein